MPIDAAASFLMPPDASSARRSVSRSTHSMFCRRFGDGSPPDRFDDPLQSYVAAHQTESFHRTV
jgi:hypothetical protein